MAKPQAINRIQELESLSTLINSTEDQGKIVTITGPKGIGKTMFLGIVRQELESRGIAVLTERILAADTPLSFFYRFFSGLEALADSKVERLKTFLSEHSYIIKSALNIISMIPGVPNVTAAVEPFLDKNQASKIIVQLEEHFLSLVRELTLKLPDQKFIIMLDDIDTSSSNSEFAAVISDMHEKLPSKTALMLAAKEKFVDSSEIIPLANFGVDEVREFVEVNLPKIAGDEDIIVRIAEMSGGYPSALGWLWENHRRGEDTISLLSRLSKEGFLEQLQRNFLRLLTANEQKVLQACSALRFTDARVVSSISGVDRSDSKEILEDFSQILAIEPVNYYVLKNKEILNLYAIHPTFKLLIERDRGIDVSLQLKAINYYARSVLEESYPLPTAIVGFMLERYSDCMSNQQEQGSALDLFDKLNLDIYQKVNLWFSIMEHLALRGDKTMTIDFVDAMDKLSGELDVSRRSFVQLWIRYYRCLNNDDDLGMAHVIEDVRSHFESIFPGQPDESQKALQTYLQDILKLTSRRLRGEDIGLQELTPIFEQAGLEGVARALESKAFQLLIAAQMGEKFLASENIEAGYEILSQVYDEWITLTDEEKRKFFQTKDQDYSQTEFLLMQRAIEYVFGMACLLKAIEISSKEEATKTDVEALLLRAADLLKSYETDKVRGRYYQLALQLLDQIRYPED